MTDRIGEARLVPHGWPCRLDACPPGPFVTADGTFGFRSDYSTETGPDAYLLEGGDYFAGGVPTHADRRALLVQPLALVIVPPEDL